MEIIRIPTKYAKQFSRISNNQKSFILISLFSLSEGKDIVLPNSTEGDLLEIIWGDCVRMEKKHNKEYIGGKLLPDTGTECGNVVPVSVACNAMQCNAMQERKEKENINLSEKFEIFRKNFGGTKRGLETEFENFRKKHKDWEECLEKLNDAVEKEKAWREEKMACGQFVPEWKNLQTWINQRCWEQEFEEIVNTNEAVFIC